MHDGGGEASSGALGIPVKAKRKKEKKKVATHPPLSVFTPLVSQSYLNVKSGKETLHDVDAQLFVVFSSF
jgi:hypothetical protein